MGSFACTAEIRGMFRGCCVHLPMDIRPRGYDRRRPVAPDTRSPTPWGRWLYLIRSRALVPPVKLTPPEAEEPVVRDEVASRVDLPAAAGNLNAVVLIPGPRFGDEAKPWPASPKRFWNSMRTSPVMRSAVVGESP